MQRMKINKNYVIIAQAILMTAIVLSKEDTTEGFTQFKEPMVQTEDIVQIQLHQYPPQDIVNMYHAMTGEIDYDVIAFSHPVKDGCLVYAVDIEGWNDTRGLAALGHEIMHCYGANHE